jgi:hypothetical protein
MSASDATADPEPAVLATLALAFEQRVDRLPDSLDPSWRGSSALCSLADVLPPGGPRRATMLRVFRGWCGPLPALTDLAPAAGRLALLERIALLGHLCVLAVMARPGALRCCVEKRPRQALQQALGPVFDTLRDVSQSGGALPAHAAAWTPMQWACVGYLDLVRARLWPHRSVRRLVRLALPKAWPVPLADFPPARIDAAVALAGTRQLVGGPPC